MTEGTMTPKEAWARVKTLGAMKLAYRQQHGAFSQETLSFCRPINEEIDQLIALMFPKVK